MALCPSHEHRWKRTEVYSSGSSSNSFSVKSSVLDKDLTPEELTVVNIFRQYGPSVAFVTSSVGDSGMSLGSGSGFIVADDGYLVTNYHVIQRSYVANQRWDRLRNSTLSGILRRRAEKEEDPPTQVKVRVNSSSKYWPARIVDVRPEHDLAVLKVTDNSTTYGRAIPVGSSADLLVGQKVVAIGNPFGLDRTVTSGVVSALNREFTGIDGNRIKNCIQTDAAINPGNSGGPLLDSKGRWIGVNTAIISTSGSSAGIGFAVPVDVMKRDVQDIIDKDRGGAMRGYIGCKILNDNTKQKLSETIPALKTPGAVIASVAPGSPAEKAGLKPLQVSKVTGKIVGDCIIAVNSKLVNNAHEFRNELESRKEKEQLDITLLNMEEEKRVVYLQLSHKTKK